MKSARVNVELDRSFLDRLVESGLGADHERAFNNALFFAAFLERYKDADGAIHIKDGAAEGCGRTIVIRAYAPRPNLV